MPGQRQQEQPERPALWRNLSSFFVRRTDDRAATAAAADHSPLLPTSTDTRPRPRPHPRTRLPASPASYLAISPAPSDTHSHRLPSAHAAPTTTPRPTVGRAATSATATRTEHKDALLSRPQLTDRSLTSTTALAGRLEFFPEPIMASSQPSLFSRAKTVISNQLELGEGTSYAHKNAPPPPSHWNDATHSRHMVKLWDAIEDRAANAKSHVSTTARLVSTEKNMLHAFPELNEGPRTLTHEWIEYILGVALRHPFCTREKMGRWEILASSSGTRGTWGPW